MHKVRLLWPPSPPRPRICRSLSSAYILLSTNTGRLESNNHSYPSGFESRPWPALNSSISSTPRPKLGDTYPRQNATPRLSLLSFLFVSVCRKNCFQWLLGLRRRRGNGSDKLVRRKLTGMGVGVHPSNHSGNLDRSRRDIN